MFRNLNSLRLQRMLLQPHWDPHSGKARKHATSNGAKRTTNEQSSWRQGT